MTNGVIDAPLGSVKKQVYAVLPKVPLPWDRGVQNHELKLLQALNAKYVAAIG
jgi:hypothetical protein